MTARCHLCGREGSRGFMEARAALLEDQRGNLPRQWGRPVVTVTICAARRACNQRRGVPIYA